MVADRLNPEKVKSKVKGSPDILLRDKLERDSFIRRARIYIHTITQGENNGPGITGIRAQ